MSDTLLVSTRKGLFTVSRKRGAWAISAVDFLGDNVSVTLADRPRWPAICGSRSRSFRRQAPPLDSDWLGGDCRPDVSTQTGRLRRDRYVGPAPGLERGSHLGAQGASATTSQASFGVERFRAVFPTQAIRGRAGR